MEYLQDAETEEAISEEMRLWRLRSMMRESANLTRQDFRCPKRGMMEGKFMRSASMSARQNMTMRFSRPMVR